MSDVKGITTYMEGNIGELTIPLIVSTVALDGLSGVYNGSHYHTCVFIRKKSAIFDIGTPQLLEREFDESPYQNHLETVRYLERQGFRRNGSGVVSGIQSV